MMDAASPLKLGVLFFGRKRPGFDLEWAQMLEDKTRSFLASTPYTAVYHDAVVADRASLDAALATCRAAEVDVLVALQPAMSDGRLAMALGHAWPGCIVLWATPERPEGPKVSSCSLVGTHVFAANLRQSGHPIELVYGAPGDPATAAQLEDAVRVAHAHNGLRKARVGLIGYHAPGFVDMHADPFALARHVGAQLWHTGLEDLVTRMDGLDAHTVQADVAATVALGLPLEDISEDELAVASRYYLALKGLITEEGLDALALREWPELPNRMGQWPYLALCRLLNEGFPVACEGDVDGALTSLIGCLLGAGPGYLSDWLGHDDTAITLWHGGCAPLALCAGPGSADPPRIARHFNSGKPAVVNAVLAADQPLTLCRVWRCAGAFRLAAEEGVTTPPARRLYGTVGAFQLEGERPHAWFRRLCLAGMPHHLVALPGRQKDRLHRLAALMEWDTI